nr:MAG TPA: hypothetical protein [Caudoviricetes sp.]
MTCRLESSHSVINALCPTFVGLFSYALIFKPAGL